MAKEIINLAKEVERAVHSSRFEDKALYARMNYDNTKEFNSEWFNKATKNLLSPSLIKKIDISTPKVITDVHRISNKNITVDVPGVDGKPIKREMFIGYDITNTKTIVRFKGYQSTVDVNHFDAIYQKIVAGELKLTGNPLSILNKPFYLPNIEELYFNELIFLSEDVLALVGANSFNDLPKILGIISNNQNKAGKSLIMQLLAKSNTDSGTIEEMFNRYPRLKAFGYIGKDRNIFKGMLKGNDLIHFLGGESFLRNADNREDRYIMLGENNKVVGEKALISKPMFKGTLIQGNIPSCLVYSKERELSTKFITHSRIYLLDNIYLGTYFSKKSQLLKELLQQEDVGDEKEKVEEKPDIGSIEHRKPENLEVNLKHEPVPIADAKKPVERVKGSNEEPMIKAKEPEGEEYNESLHGAFKEMISKLIVDSWEDLYGKYVSGLEEISGLIVPSGVITSPKGDSIKHQGIISLKSSGSYVKEFPFSNAIYEEFIRAMQMTGISVVKKPSDDKERTIPYQYNPKLQKAIASGDINRNTYLGGWRAYKKTLTMFVEPLAKKLAVEKESTGNDTEIYDMISSYLISLLVINYKPGMGFQLRISCGKPALSKLFAENIRKCLIEREQSESKSLFMGKAKFSDVFISESGGSVELTVYLNMVAFQAVPDLLGELLVNLEDGMFVPSVDNIMLGRKLDNSIAFLNLKASGWLVPIIAGSRSGKGVQTLNILANIITLQLCLFYLDDKPDMVIQLWELAKHVGINNPVAVDGLKVSGKTEVDSKDFKAPYELFFTNAKKLKGAHPVISEHLTTMVYLKTLLVIRLAFLYNRSIMGSKYGDIFVVADEIYKLSETVKNIYSSVELKMNELKFKEKTVKDKTNINKQKQELNLIISWMENLWSEYNSAGIGEFNLGIHFISLSQFDSIDRYTGGGTGASFKQFMTTFAMKGFGTSRIYGRRQESLTNTQYGLETYTKGTGSSKEDIELIQSYRHFTLTNGDNKLLHERIYKPLLVINENDSKEFKQMQGVGGEDGAFVATMIGAMKKSGVSEAQIAAFRQRVFENPAVANAVGFKGVLQEMARLTGTNYEDNIRESLRKAVELSQEALEYFGIISPDTGINSVYEYICSTKVEHLWTYSQIKNCKENGLPLSTVFQDGEEQLPEGDGSGEGTPSIFSDIDYEDSKGSSSLSGDYNEKKPTEQQNIAAFSDTPIADFSEHDTVGIEAPNIAFEDEDKILRDMASGAYEDEENPELHETETVEYVLDDSEKNLDTDDLYTALLSRVSVNGDPLGYIAQQLDNGTKNGNISKEQARVLSAQLDLVGKGYLTSIDFDNKVYTGKGEMKIDPSVMVSIGDDPALNRVGKDIEIDLQKNRSGVRLNKDTSINCLGAGKVSLGFFENIMLKTPYGVELYVTNLWRSILNTIIKQGHRPAFVTRVSLYGGNLFVNKKICLLNHIIGGKENVRLVDIVQFKELFRKFPRIKELRLDEEFLRAVVAEFGDYGMEELFNWGRELQVVYLKTLTGKNRVINRNQIQSGFLPEEAYNASIANEIDLRCKNILDGRKTNAVKSKEKQDLWGHRAAAYSNTNEAKKYRQRMDRKGIKSIFRKGGAFLGASLGAVLYGFGSLLDFASGKR